MLPDQLIQRLQLEYGRDSEGILTQTGITKDRLHQITTGGHGYLNLSELECIAHVLGLDPLSITEPVEPSDRVSFRLVHARNSDSLEGYIYRVTGADVSASSRIHSVHRKMVERGFVPVYLAKHAYPTSRSDPR